MTLFLCGFFFIAHLSGKHNALFTSGLNSMFDGVALTLSEIKFFRPVQYVTINKFRTLSSLITAKAVWPFPSILPHSWCQPGLKPQVRPEKHNWTKKQSPAAKRVHFVLHIRFHKVFVKFHTECKSPAYILEDLLEMNPLRGLQTSSSLAQPLSASYFGVLVLLPVVAN